MPSSVKHNTAIPTPIRYLHACIQCNHIFKPSRQTLPLQVNSLLCIECCHFGAPVTVSLFGSSRDEQKSSVSPQAKFM